MRSSYLILDEYMCFLNKEKGTNSRSLLEVGVQKLLEEVKWDGQAFVERGGLYEWTRESEEDEDEQLEKGVEGQGGGGGCGCGSKDFDF